MLNHYMNMKTIFIKFYTVLPSSAPVKRLFSTAAIILCKSQGRLGDSIFEKLLLLRQNRHAVKLLPEITVSNRFCLVRIMMRTLQEQTVTLKQKYDMIQSLRLTYVKY
jgi:hypothetical protein